MKKAHLASVLLLLFVFVLMLTVCKKDDDGPQGEKLYGWAAGQAYDGFGTILHTENGGSTWVRQGDASMIPDADLMDIRAVDEDNVWATGMAFKGDPVILRTSDGGKTWKRQGMGSRLPASDLIGICPVSEMVCWAAGEDGTILKTTDGGENWIYLKAAPDYMSYYQMIAATDENHAWAIGEGDSLAMIHYTSDGGQTWVRQGLDDLTTGNMPNALIDIHAATKDYIWAVGPSQAIYSLDGGNSWVNKPTPIGFNHNNGVCIIDENKVWVASDYNSIFKLSGTENNWVEQESQARPAMYMGITATDENTAWISTVTYTSTGQILHTSDGGNTWAIQPIPHEIALRRITFASAKR